MKFFWSLANQLKCESAVAIFSICFFINATMLWATDPWPGGAESTRIDITQSDMGSNLSGAIWNPITKKLWTVSNNGSFWRMRCNSATDCHVAANWISEGKWIIGGDPEAITQAAWGEQTVFIGMEQANGTNHRLIREYDVSGTPGSVVLKNEWNLVEMRIGANNDGLESLTFVPDAWLIRAGFRKASNDLYSGSLYASEGLFFAGLQRNGADIFVYDLNRQVQGQYTFIGQYDVGQTEIAELQFDRSDGTLYSLHNYGQSSAGTGPCGYIGGGSPDIFQALSLTPVGTGTIKSLPVLQSWYGPRIHNNEGFTIVQNSDRNTATQRDFFLTTDDGGICDSLGIYPQFPVMDEDLDGVNDYTDQCLGTNIGTLVNSSGCALSNPTLTGTATATSTATILPTATRIPTATVTATSIPMLTPTAAYTPVQTIAPQPLPIKVSDTWSYKKGISAPPINWNALDFNDSSWNLGATSIGYGDGDDLTVLDDMINAYTSVYLRKKFEIQDLSLVGTLTLNIDYDDGFVAYLNGVEVARRNLPAGTIEYNTLALGNHEASLGNSSPNPPEQIDLSAAVATLALGTNIIAIEIHNQTLSSSDLSSAIALEVNVPVPPTFTYTATAVPGFTPTITATNSPTRTLTATHTNTALPTASSTFTATPSYTPSTTATSTFTASPTHTIIATSTNTTLPTASATSSPTATATNTPTFSATYTAIPTQTSTATSTSTLAPTQTATATSTSTLVPTQTATQTKSATVTKTATSTATSTAISTNTYIPTATSLPTATKSATAFATLTPVSTQTPLPSSTRTAIKTATSTATQSRTNTPVPSATATKVTTAAWTPTKTFTASATATPTASKTPSSTATAVSTPTLTPTPTLALSPTRQVVQDAFSGTTESLTQAKPRKQLKRKKRVKFTTRRQ